MTKTDILPTAFHEISKDVEGALKSNEGVLAKWNAITPLARNEWVCWITMVKKEETRQERIVRMQKDILGGKKRPCCWPGCPHCRRM